MRKNRFITSILLLSVTFALHAQTYTNPVIEGVADGGAFKYAGKYYFGGVATYGDFFVSSDLVNWDKRIHVFDLDNDWTHGTGAKNNQVHANDMSYSGGLFHLLFSVNYWGRDRHAVHITHATSKNIEGPYEEVRKDQWFENRIDPMVFCDEDGKLYLYMVKFTDGNTIWGRPMNADFTFSGDAVQQFSSQQGTWETMDNRVAEGPFVVKYHGRYYMMYNANHTAAEFGNYRLGVCEADAPLAFNPGGKYPYPVVSPQTDLLEENYTDIIRYGSNGYNGIDLNKDTITFRVDNVPATPYLKIAQRGGIKMWLNGNQIDTNKNSDYKLIKINPQWINKGVNIITFERPESRVIQPGSTEPNRTRRSSRLVALAIYDIIGTAPLNEGSLLLTPGQPNILRGPNGWEWWLVYMANNGFRRDQYIDRVHFVNSHMTVDGITGHNTNGFHVAPAKPQYAGTDIAALPKSDAYLFEATFKSSADKSGIRIGNKEILLPSTMDKAASHVWRIERNHNLLAAWIDNILVADYETISADDAPAWIGNASDYDVEYLSFNEGFDEYGKKFSGWQGNLSINDEGMKLRNGEFFKSNAADDYSVSVQFSNAELEHGKYGVYAAYVDAKNNIKAVIDADKQALVVENTVKGKTDRQEIPLATTVVHYPDLKGTDSFEKQYWFDSPTMVSSVEMPHLDADNDPYARSLSLQEQTRLDYQTDMIGRMTMEYLDGDKWRPIEYTDGTASNRAWQKAVFSPVKTRALRFINKDPQQHNRNIYRIKTTRDIASDMQLRIEKRGNEIHIFVDNRELSTITQKKAAPARVGLIADENSNVVVKNVLYYPVF